MGEIFAISLLLFLGFRNGSRARQKGQNGLLWGILTVVAFVIFQAIGLLLVVSFFCQGVVDLNLLTTPGMDIKVAQDKFRMQVGQAMIQNPLRPLTVLLFGFGGYLLVRYLIGRRPGKQPPMPSA